MDDLQTIAPPRVWLGPTVEDSIAVSIYVLVRDRAHHRPELSTAMRGCVLMRFVDGYPAVRITFTGDGIEVADDGAEDDRPYDLVLSGRLADIAALIVAPLAGGLPNPATRPGRRAIVRLADGRIDLDGPLALARELLRLLAVDADRTPERRPARQLEHA
jgi:hypothetical protein